MIWFLLRTFLFLFPPEAAHSIALNALKFLYPFLSFKKKYHYSTQLWGLHFQNPVGLAAGLDKNGDYIDALGALGFGFIEIGTVTPHPQSGNPKPRLFRYNKHQALINHMGFNNKGVDYVVERLKQKKYKGILGVNIGKNKTTPLKNAVSDYVYCFKKLAALADYITINISSPNTKNLRDLHHPDLLNDLLQQLKKVQIHFFQETQKYVPLIIKISPDIQKKDMPILAKIFLNYKIDGIIATNTTVDFDSISNKTGGLSGKPLIKKSTDILKTFKKYVKNNIPLIGCGGIFSKEDAKEKYQAGASLIQIYTGLIYCGPKILNELNLPAKHVKLH